MCVCVFHSSQHHRKANVIFDKFDVLFSHYIPKSHFLEKGTPWWYPLASLVLNEKKLKISHNSVKEFYPIQVLRTIQNRGLLNKLWDINLYHTADKICITVHVYISMYVCISVYVHAHVFIYVYVHVYMCIYLCMCTHTCAYTHVCACIYLCACVYIHAAVSAVSRISQGAICPTSFEFRMVLLNEMLTKTKEPSLPCY